MAHPPTALAYDAHAPTGRGDPPPDPHVIAWLLALRHLRARPAAALVTLLGVAIGVAGVRAMALGSDGALATLRAAYEDASGPATWVALPAGDPRALLPAEAVSTLSAAPGVTGTIPLLTTPTVRIEELKLWFGVLLPEGDAGLLLVGAGMAPPASRQWRILEGEAPSCATPCTLSGASVLVGEAWARGRRLRVGSALNLAVAGRFATVTIAGTVERWGLGTRGFGRVVIAPLAAMREGLGVPADAVGELGLVTERQPPVLPGVAMLRPGDRGADVAQRLANLRAGTDLLSGVTLLLAGLLVAGQAAARAAERGRVIGLLRAVGATRGQVVATLVIEVVIVALPGALLGLLIARPLADGVAFALGQAAQADLRVDVFDAGGAVWALTLGVLTAGIAALAPAIGVARAAPLEGLRARGRAGDPPALVWAAAGVAAMLVSSLSFLVWPADTAPRPATLARAIFMLLGACACLPPLLPRLIPRRVTLPPAVALGVAALRWRPVRSGLAAGTVLICIAMVGGVGALGRGVSAELDRWSGRALGFDLYASRPDGFSAEDVVHVRSLPGVTEAVGVTVQPVTAHIGDRDVALALVGVEPTAWAELVDVVGGGEIATLQPDEALVPTVVAAQLGVEVGDVITAGDLRFEVRALVVDYTQNGFAILVSRAALGDVRADVVAVRGDARASLEALPGVTVESRAELRGRIRRLVDQSMAALDVLLWLAGAVGVLAVGAALAQSSLERRADLALLRAVGLERSQIATMFVTEGVATAAVGIVPGLPLGVLLGWIFASATRTLGLPIPYVPAWGPLVGAAVAAALTAALAAWIPSRRASGRSPSEALRE